MSQYPPNFSYVEVDKAVGLYSLDLTMETLIRVHKEILEDLDSKMEELDLKTLVFDKWDLDCLASYVGLPHFSN